MPATTYTPQPYTGPSKQSVLAQRQKHVNPGIFLYYKKPVMIVEGKGQYMFDEEGNRFVDALGGIVTVSIGHCHPDAVAAATTQNNLIQHTTTCYLNPEIGRYAEKLAATLPGDLSVCYFVNSGSEANDLATMMARAYTENYELIALRNAYHGMSTFAMGLTAHSTWKHNIPQGFGIHHALNPNPYRGAFGADGAAYAADVHDLISTATSGRVAGFIAETIQGVGGTVELAPDYLKHTYEIIRAAGGLCIADEVQTGFGRLGTHFWGFETHGVTPDIVTMAKGMGNGAPLAAVVTTPAIAAAMAQKIHFNTYGGNPVSMRIGSAVLDVIERDQLQEHCLVVGAHMKQRLVALMAKHALIGDVRGQGLMLGVELVLDRATKAPATDATAQVFETMKDLGVLVGKGGLAANVLRIKPPMCITREDCDFVVDVMDEALSRTSQ
jgi:alanine-glyoxylate transaminase/(R)-3-amino-2-methylpropionate-pyruvate transaminase